MSPQGQPRIPQYPQHLLHLQHLPHLLHPRRFSKLNPLHQPRH